MARLIPLLPAPRGNLPARMAPPGDIIESAAALPARGTLRTIDPRVSQRRRVSRWVCDHYRAGRPDAERGVLCDFST